MAEFRMRPDKLVEYAKMVAAQKGRNPNACIFKYRDHPNGQQSVNVYNDDSDDEDLICNVVPAELKKWHRMNYDLNKLYNEEVEYINNSKSIASDTNHARALRNLIISSINDENAREPAADPRQITANDFKPYIRRR